MPIETLTYAALGSRLKISPLAARSLAKRRRLPCSLSDNGKALVSVDLAEIRHAPRRPGSRQTGDVALQAEKILALQAEVARLEATAASHRADFERERERADRLTTELLHATAEATAAKEAAARLEGSLRTGGRPGSPIDGHGQATSRLGHLLADLVEADRRACK
ncbi:hypothetical protein Q3C01_41800 [Bradyrhizobium sp. UFLA05-109]